MAIVLQSSSCDPSKVWHHGEVCDNRTGDGRRMIPLFLRTPPAMPIGSHANWARLVNQAWRRTNLNGASRFSVCLCSRT
jgi:hypothetical protein